MEQIKLKDLYLACQKLMKEGQGEKHLLVSGDNEGNSFHGMFYTLTPITNENKEGFIGLIGNNAEPDILNLIVVG